MIGSIHIIEASEAEKGGIQDDTEKGRRWLRDTSMLEDIAAGLEVPCEWSDEPVVGDTWHGGWGAKYEIDGVVTRCRRNSGSFDFELVNERYPESVVMFHLETAIHTSPAHPVS